LKPSILRTRQLAHSLLEGDVIACPAESVWGLTCDPWDHDAVLSLLAMKHRPVSKGLIVVAAHVDMFTPLLDGLDDKVRKELILSWPGPNTWLVPNKGFFPDWITGDSEEVAIRVTSAPALRALSLEVGQPLVSTSANPAGALPARHHFQVVRYFGADLPRATGMVDLAGKPSTIRRAGSGEVIRPG